MTAFCHHLFHNTTTIEEGDDIAVVTFFIRKPPKKVMVIIVAIFCNKAIEEGDGSCHLFLLFCKNCTEEGDDSLVPLFFFVATEPHKNEMSFSFFQTQRRRQRQLLPSPFLL
jgi:hypothetical protein